MGHFHNVNISSHDNEKTWIITILTDMIQIRQTLAPYEDDFAESIAFVEEKCKSLFGKLHFTYVHGDFRPANILYNQSDEKYYLIDFENFMIGDPTLDIYKMLSILKSNNIYNFKDVKAFLNGYANRDYKKALNAVLWLVKNEDMTLEDRRELLLFFKKCWNKYKDTTPCLIFVPVAEVGVNEDASIEQYLSDEGIDNLFSDILSGTVNPIKNCCCKKTILPNKLSFVDLSPILPHSKKDDISISQRSNSITIDDNDER